MMRVVMEVAGLAATAGRVSRRSAISGLASLALHGGLLLLVFVLAGVRVMPERHVIELTTIQVVEPPPPPAPGQSGTMTPSPARTSAGTLGRRGHDAPQRSASRAPAVANPFAELAVSYDTPTGPDPGNEAGTGGLTVGSGLWGDGAGGDGGRFGVGGMGVPPPPPPAVSRARPPRPKLDYHTWDFRASRRFAGQAVLVELSIDAGGHVGQVRVMKSVDPAVDHHAMDLARRFEFYPALDPDGHPTPGLHRWEFVIVGDNDTDFHFQPRL